LTGYKAEFGHEGDMRNLTEKHGRMRKTVFGLWLPASCLILAFTVFSGAAFAETAAATESNGTEWIQTSQIISYKVKRGDTLWDISMRLYDTAALWPDLWKLNPHIKNPHWIEPGTVLNIYQRDGMSLDTEKELRSGPDPWGSGAPPEKFVYPSMAELAFLRPEPLVSIGRIMLSDGDQKVMLSKGDVIYLKFTDNIRHSVGERFTIFNSEEKVIDPDKDDATIGYLHHVVGQAMITDVYPKNAVAKIIESYRPIKVDDGIMPFEPPDSEIHLTSAVSGLAGRVLATEKLAEVFGRGDIVFIDKGENEGVKPGQTYSLFNKRVVETWDDLELEEMNVPPQDMGKILILQAEKTTATALVLQSRDMMEPGSRVRNVKNTIRLN
jgi:hypothetical protein